MTKMDRGTNAPVVPIVVSPAPTAGPDSLRGAADWALLGLFVIALFTVLKIASALFIPISAALIVGSVLSRASTRMTAWGIPYLAAALVLVALVGAAIVVAFNALLDPMTALVKQAPTMLSTLADALKPVIEPLTSLRKSIAPAPQGGEGATGLISSDSALIGNIVTGLTPALNEFLIFFVTLAFFVIGRQSMRKDLILSWSNREHRLTVIRIVNAVEDSLGVYFKSITLVFLGIGFATGVVASLFGLPNPWLWGAMTFAASFIPYVGPALITLALAAAGVVSFGQLIWGLAPAAAYLVVYGITDNLILPPLLGRRLEINAFFVFLATVFWVWMWGPIGAVLAVPILIICETIRAELQEDTTPTLPG